MLQAYVPLRGKVADLAMVVGTKPVPNDVPVVAAADAEAGAVAGVVSAVAAAEAGAGAVAGVVPAVAAVEAGPGTMPGVVEGVMPVAAGGVLGTRDLGSILAMAGVDVRSLLGPVPAYGTYGASIGVIRAVDEFGLLAGTECGWTNRVIEVRPVTGTAKSEVDPFLAMIEIWSEGPLGEMRRRANLTRGRGDAAAFGREADEYWRAMNAAMERRETFNGRGGRARVTVGP